jgi:putative transposase
VAARPLRSWRPTYHDHAKGSPVTSTRAQEELDWLLITGRGHLEQVLRIYVEHYNGHRPHRALQLESPDARTDPVVISDNQRRVLRRDRLSGLLHEYHRQAA